ncbi:hypothetical protein [Promicromonospora sp. NFX87]|uniref:hypothetical protein n=1 Tax=Promicromonospora sp. NFX87 TaxID=3402691 RepID=UPI003AFAB1E3
MRDRYTRGTLSVPQIVALEQRPGWTWGIWYERADRVAAYLADNGSLDGLYNHDRVLYAWLQHQLRADLKPEQASRLAELTGDHDTRSHLEVFIDDVQAWLEQDDQRTLADLKVSVTYTTPDGTSVLLGKKAANYRSRYNTGKLAPQDVELIDARLPGWVWTRA